MNQYDIELSGGEEAVLLIHGLTGNPFEILYVVFLWLTMSR